MSSVKILHIADLHIGRKFRNLNSRKSASRGIEVLLTLERTLERFADAKLVLMAGDIFEEDASSQSIDFVCNLIKKHSDKRFFLSCGNHDCSESLAIKEFSAKAPQNIHIFSQSIEKISIEDLGVNVFGASFSAPTMYSSLLSGFVAKESEYVNIMVLHGEIGADSVYNPIAPKDIAESGLDYIALGHIHSFSGINTADSVSYAYSGVLEPGGFDECGECGAIYGEVSKQKAELEFYPVSLRQYHHIELDITDFVSNEEVAGELNRITSSSDLYNVSLVGSPGVFVPDTELLEDSSNSYYIEIENNCTNADSVLNYIGENSLRGKTAEMLLNLKDSSEEDVYNEAEKILTNLMCKD